MTDEPRECNIQTTGGELEVNKSQRIICCPEIQRTGASRVIKQNNRAAYLGEKAVEP